MSLMSPREPWNKGKLVGQKRPLRPKRVWSIRTRLQMEGRTRDLAMFNPAIDSKLRGCDVVALRFEDVAPRKGRVYRQAAAHLAESEGHGHIRQRLSAYLCPVNVVSRQTR
jgi:hypothetical protein